MKYYIDINYLLNNIPLTQGALELHIHLRYIVTRCRYIKEIIIRWLSKKEKSELFKKTTYPQLRGQPTALEGVLDS
jgi:hypothetical protein